MIDVPSCSIVTVLPQYGLPLDSVPISACGSAMTRSVSPSLVYTASTETSCIVSDVSLQGLADEQIPPDVEDDVTGVVQLRRGCRCRIRSNVVQ